MTDIPITRNSQGDRGYKKCKCTKCGVERTCTPSFDFYTWEQGEDPDLLICQNCVLVKPISTINASQLLEALRRRSP